MIIADFNIKAVKAAIFKSLEDLGLEPDLNNQKLRVLPVEGKDTYLTVL